MPSKRAMEIFAAGLGGAAARLGGGLKSRTKSAAKKGTRSAETKKALKPVTKSKINLTLSGK